MPRVLIAPSMVRIFHLPSGGFMNARASPAARIQACHLLGDATLIKKDQPVQVDPANHLDELFTPLAILFRVPFLAWSAFF